MFKDIITKPQYVNLLAFKHIQHIYQHVSLITVKYGKSHTLSVHNKALFLATSMLVTVQISISFSFSRFEYDGLLTYRSTAVAKGTKRHNYTYYAAQ